MLGTYTIGVETSKFPQDLASGFDIATEKMLGAEYDLLALLGKKVVNGVNYATLAKQTIISSGKDVDSICLVVLNSQPGDVDGKEMRVVQVETLVTNGGALGGFKINPSSSIPEEAKNAWDKKFAGFVGSNIEPFMFLGSQVVGNGTAYKYAAKSTMIVNPNCIAKTQGTKVVLVTIILDEIVAFDDIITGSESAGLLQGTQLTWP